MWFLSDYWWSLWNIQSLLMEGFFKRFFIVIDLSYFSYIFLFFILNTVHTYVYSELIWNFMYSNFFEELYRLNNKIFFHDDVRFFTNTHQFIESFFKPIFLYGIYSIIIPLRYIFFGKIYYFPWSPLTSNNQKLNYKINFYFTFSLFLYFSILVIHHVVVPIKDFVVEKLF